MCAWAVGRPTAGAGLPAQPQPRARKHSKRQAGPEKYDQFLMRSAHRLPNIRVPSHDLIRRRSQPAAVGVGRPGQPPQHLHLAHQQLGPVRLCSAVFLNVDWDVWVTEILTLACLPAGCRRGVAPAVTAVETSRILTVEEAPLPFQLTRPFIPHRALQPLAFPSHTSPPSSPPWVRSFVSFISL